MIKEEGQVGNRKRRRYSKENPEPRLFPRITRDTVLFATGICLIIYEAVIRDGPERPSLIILYAGMVGLPGVLRLAEAMQGNKQE